MAMFSCKFKSAKLGHGVDFIAILPESVKEGKYRTMYLLHGLSDDYSTWSRNTSIERYANERGIAVIMPDGERSFYCDMYLGRPYYSYIMEELIPYTRRIFPLSEAREDTFVAGLSMGGYGALKFALRNPDVFAAGASFSGVTDIAVVATDVHNWGLARLIWENPELVEGSDDDLFALATKRDAEGRRPRIYQECGTEDFLYESNVKFREHMKQLQFDYHYEERPGVHTWSFWDVCVPKAMDFFLQK